MVKNKKKIIATTLAATMIICTSSLVAYEYNNNINVRRQTNDFIYSTFFGLDYSVPNGAKYSDFDPLKMVYYVHKNDKRTIISTSKYVKGYDCLGEYNSRSSAEELFYIAYSNDRGETTNYSIISYDDIEKDNRKIFEYVSDLALIDENSPEEVTAFIPECSIDKIDTSLVKK